MATQQSEDGNPLSFGFWADAPTNSPLSYEQLQLRRKLASELAARGRPAETTVGGGIQRIGEALGERFNLGSLDRQEAAYQRQADLEAQRAAGSLAPEAPPPPSPLSYSSRPPPDDGPSDVPAAGGANEGQAPPAIPMGSTTIGGLPPPAPEAGPSFANANPSAPLPPPQGFPVAAPAQMATARDAVARALMANPQGTLRGLPPPPGGGPLLPFASPASSPSAGGGAEDAGTPPIVMADMRRAPPGGPEPRAGPPPAPAAEPYYRSTPFAQQPGLPPPPRLAPPGPQERAAMARIMAAPTDPHRVGTWKPVVDALAAQRMKDFGLATDLYKAQLGDYFAGRKEERTAYRGQEDTDIERAMKREKLPTQTLNVPGVDQSLLNTPQSPQRTGVPSLPPVPVGISPQAWREAQLPLLKADMAKAEQANVDVPQALAVIDQIRHHPGKDSGVGLLGSSLQGIGGSKAKDFAQFVAQANGTAFLKAYQAIRGSGAISNVEGEKAQTAVARMSTAQSKEGFDAALNDFEQSLRRGHEVVQRKVNQPVTAYQRSPNEPFAPDIGAVENGYAYLGGPRRDPSSWRRLP